MYILFGQKSTELVSCLQNRKTHQQEENRIYKSHLTLCCLAVLKFERLYR